LLNSPPTDWSSEYRLDLRDRKSFECNLWWKSTLYSEAYWGGESEDHPDLFRTTVYNLEVEDCHSYYVGTRGIWVRNASVGNSVSA